MLWTLHSFIVFVFLTLVSSEIEFLGIVHFVFHFTSHTEINRLSSAGDPSQPQSEKIFVSFDDQKKFNLIGRLLGPKGLTLKRIQAETNTKMSILGRGSIKDRNKEEELRNSGNPAYAHLREDLHVLIEATPPSSLQKIAAGVAEVHKMLIPPVS